MASSASRCLTSRRRENTAKNSTFWLHFSTKGVDGTQRPATPARRAGLRRAGAARRVGEPARGSAGMRGLAAWICLFRPSARGVPSWSSILKSWFGSGFKKKKNQNKTNTHPRCEGRRRFSQAWEPARASALLVAPGDHALWVGGVSGPLFLLSTMWVGEGQGRFLPHSLGGQAHTSGGFSLVV